jgi:hypothetical protein
MQFVCIVGFDWLLFYIEYSIYKSQLRGPAGRIRYLENVKFYVSYFLQYTKIIQMTTMQTYFSKILIKLKIEAYTKPKKSLIFTFKLKVYIWRHVVYVPKSLKTFRGI